jgi:hypothetical protein
VEESPFIPYEPPPDDVFIVSNPQNPPKLPSVQEIISAIENEDASREAVVFRPFRGKEEEDQVIFITK